MNDKRGHCRKHGTIMKVILVSNKKWCDLGRNKGYGWKYEKTRKFICKDKDNPPLCPDIAYRKERFSDNRQQRILARRNWGLTLLRGFQNIL